jgi:hypothetical protein
MASCTGWSFPTGTCYLPEARNSSSISQAARSQLSKRSFHRATTVGPVFNEFIEKGHTFDRVKGLDGEPGDAGLMKKLILDKLGDKYGLRTIDDVTNWLAKYETKYGKGLAMHHSGPGQFQLVPRAVHDAARHGRFEGSASAAWAANTAAK